MNQIMNLSITTALAIAGGALADTTVVDFESGAEGWVGPECCAGFTEILPTGGNPDAHMHTVFNDFGITFDNSTNAAFAQDYTQHDSVTFSMDLKVDDISFFGTPAARPWLIEIRDYDNVPAGYPYVSVWYLFDWVGQGEWTTWSVTIDDTSAVDLPAGWGGYGAEDPKTFEPILPANRSFTDVLAGCDEVAYTTLQPGFFFGFTDFEVRLDNITVETSGAAIPGDINGDGVVDTLDLLILLNEWGACTGCAADINGDGVVDVQDLLTLFANWS